MLLRLALEEFVIVERGALEFAPGLNALTGETGAGKSILVEALSLLSGGRPSGEVVRRGAERAVIEGEILLRPEVGGAGRNALAAADRLGIPMDEEGLLLLRREIGSDGRSRAFANGRSVLVSQLRELTSGILWIVGQGDQRALISPPEQEALLDRFAGSERLLQAYREARTRFLDALRAMEDLAREGEAFRGEEDWLRFQAREIREAALEPGERARLEEARLQARSAAEEAGLREEIEARLFREEGSVLDHLESLAHRLSRVSSEEWSEIRELVLELRGSARELRRRLPPAESEIPMDPEAIEERCRLIERLCRKYGGGPAGTEEAVLSHLAAVEDRIAAGEGMGARRVEAAEGLERIRRALGEAGTALSALRGEAAERFAQAVSVQLEALAMPGARLSFRFRREEDENGVGAGGARLRPLEGGLERVDLLFRSHPAEPEGELGDVASGGELSRILLALHAALGTEAPPGTWVLDEVDQGIGGETANRVAGRLAEMARHAQVLLVTHLAAIAAPADRHFRVLKGERGGRPSVTIEALGPEERLGEIARMLSGDPDSEIARRHARALLRPGAAPQPSGS